METLNLQAIFYWTLHFYLNHKASIGNLRRKESM